MSDLDDAFVELLDVNDEVCGQPQFVIIGKRKVRAIIEEITTDETNLVGGVGEAGGFRAKVRQAEFASEPKQGTSIQKMGKGKVFDILSVVGRNGVEFEILAGDLSAEAT